MASPPLLHPEMSFADFPEDVQINILSFLSPVEISAFACTSRRFASLCSASASGSLPLWFAMCHRRWGSKTSLGSWIPSAAASDEGGAAAASTGSSCRGGSLFARLYKALDRWENLIGFWRRIGHGSPGTPTLVLFEWGPSYITASRVSPSPPSSGDGYGVLKIPFIWLGLSPHGEPVSFLHPIDGAETPNVAGDLVGSSSTSELVPVTVSFMGCNHFIVEENRSFYIDARGCYGSSEDLMTIESTSPPDRLMSEIYQYLANRTSPSGDKSLRRQRKKERERLGRQRLWEAEHFVKIVNSCPTPQRPLQGLWKGISDDMVLEFYLVAYDDVGGITCRRVGEAGEQFSGYSPVFWTSNATFIEPPFPREEGDLYVVRDHIHPVASNRRILASQVVSHILCINSSYDLVIPGSSGDPRNVEGRIWEYDDGTFGFGFLRNNYIIDLKHISLNGSLLDTVEYLCNNSSL